MVRVVSWQSEKMWYRSMNRQDRDRGAETRLTERTRKLDKESFALCLRKMFLFRLKAGVKMEKPVPATWTKSRPDWKQ